MAPSLKLRFVQFVLFPLSLLLKFSGAFPESSDSKWYSVGRCWSYCWLIFCIQSNIYVTIERTPLLAFLFFSQQISGDRLVAAMTNSLIRLCGLVVDTMSHIVLVFTLWPAVMSFLKVLEPVDCKLKRPDLTKVNWCSLLSVIYMLFTVYLNWLFAIYWELFHPTRPTSWFIIFQNTIRIIANQWFTAIPVWIFVICGELIILYFQNIAACLKLQNTEVKAFNDAKCKTVKSKSLKIMRLSKELYAAAGLLCRLFSTVLMANCCLNLVIMLTSSYYVIEYIQKSVAVALWDGCDVIDSFVRFWLLCRTADRIRESAMGCIVVLRQIRDGTCNGEEMPTKERTKVTFYIVEVAQFGKHNNRLSLCEMLPLSKHLIIPMIQTILTYLVIILELQYNSF